MSKQFLLEFDYEGWCQGPEKMHTMVLVYATSFDDAVLKLRKEYDMVKNVKNRTIE
jgi:hypothetical protein